MKYDGYNLEAVILRHEQWVKFVEERYKCLFIDMMTYSQNFGQIDRADFSRATFSDKELKNFFHNRDLRGAIFAGTNLEGANFNRSRLDYCVFHAANLSNCLMEDVSLTNASLEASKLTNTSLARSNLSYAQFQYANMQEANLSNAIIEFANFSKAENIPYIPLACPDTGSFTGWKKCYLEDKMCTFKWNESAVLGLSRMCIVKLEIPDRAKRSSGTSNKCRASEALVLDIQDPYTCRSLAFECPIAISTYDHSFRYKIGTAVRPNEPFNDDRWIECGSGIHFFINREDAVRY